MEPGELRAFDRKAQVELKSTARELFPEMTSRNRPIMAINATVRLQNYARWKAQAIEARLSGEIAIAIRIEERCDSEYDRLPEWARW
jgi:hypothetical protein